MSGADFRGPHCSRIKTGDWTRGRAFLTLLGKLEPDEWRNATWNIWASSAQPHLLPSRVVDKGRNCRPSTYEGVVHNPGRGASVRRTWGRGTFFFKEKISEKSPPLSVHFSETP